MLHHAINMCGRSYASAKHEITRYVVTLQFMSYAACNTRCMMYWRGKQPQYHYVIRACDIYAIHVHVSGESIITSYVACNTQEVIITSSYAPCDTWWRTGGVSDLYRSEASQLSVSYHATSTRTCPCSLITPVHYFLLSAGPSKETLHTRSEARSTYLLWYSTINCPSSLQ